MKMKNIPFLNIRLPILLLGVGIFAVCAFAVAPNAEAQTLEQLSYRFYVNENAQTPTDPWPAGGTDLAENAAITENDEPPTTGDVIRIRMTVSVTGDPVSAGETFKLQYSEVVAPDTCSTLPTFFYTDVDAAGGFDFWRGYDNATPADGSTLSSLLISDSDVEGTYEEENTATVPTGGIAVGETMEWDWVVENNGASAGAKYCFRMVYANGTEFDTYTDYPQLETKAFVVKSQNWRWYGDEENETPTDALEAENTAPFGIRQLRPIKLRLTIKETEGTDGPNQKFGLVYSTSSDFADETFLPDTFGCEFSNAHFCFADGVDLDGDIIQNFLLTDSGVKGTHNEEPFGQSSFTHPGNAAVEYEFTIQNFQADPETTYYFRAADIGNSTSVEANTGETYPSLQTFNQILEFSITGVSASTTIDNWTTDVTSTPTTIDFGTLVPNVSKFAAHRLTTTMDGLGYQVLVRYSEAFANGSGDEIPGIPYPNDLPGSWGFDHASQSGAFGYHTTDNVLSESSTRFQDDDTWARFTETGEEIVYSDGPIENDIHDLLIRVEASPLQPAGSYSTEIIYIVSPIY